jgi:hypothetical protein
MEALLLFEAALNLIAEKSSVMVMCIKRDLSPVVPSIQKGKIEKTLRLLTATVDQVIKNGYK